jgi:hypothetical protein
MILGSYPMLRSRAAIARRSETGAFESLSFIAWEITGQPARTGANAKATT